jgi:hypothetical protein
VSTHFLFLDFDFLFFLSFLSFLDFFAMRASFSRERPPCDRNPGSAAVTVTAPAVYRKHIGPWPTGKAQKYNRRVVITVRY